MVQFGPCRGNREDGQRRDAADPEQDGPQVLEAAAGRL